MSEERGRERPWARGALLVASAQYMAAGVGLLASVVTARILGPELFGVVSLALAYPAVLWSFASFKPLYVTGRYISIFHAEGRPEELGAICKLGYLVDMLCAVLVTGIVAATGWIVARHVYERLDLTWLMIAIAASYPLYSLVGTSLAIFNSMKCYGWMGAFHVAERTFVLTAVLALLAAGWGVGGVVLGTAFGNVATGVASAGVAAMILLRIGSVRWWKVPLRRVAHLSGKLLSQFGWNYLAVACSGVVAQVPLMIIGKFRGAEEAGFFRLAVALATAAGYLEVAMGKVVFPVIAENWGEGGDREGFRGAIKRWTIRRGIPAGALVAASIPLLPFLVPFLFGAAFRPLVPAAQILLGSSAVTIALFWVYYGHYASGRVDRWAKAYSVYAVLSVALGGLAVQRWGIEGWAVVLAAGKVALYLFLAWRAYGKRIPGGAVHGIDA